MTMSEFSLKWPGQRQMKAKETVYESQNSLTNFGPIRFLHAPVFYYYFFLFSPSLSLSPFVEAGVVSIILRTVQKGNIIIIYGLSLELERKRESIDKTCLQHLIASKRDDERPTENNGLAGAITRCEMELVSFQKEGVCRCRCRCVGTGEVGSFISILFCSVETEALMESWKLTKWNAPFLHIKTSAYFFPTLLYRKSLPHSFSLSLYSIFLLMFLCPCVLLAWNWYEVPFVLLHFLLSVDRNVFFIIIIFFFLLFQVGLSVSLSRLKERLMLLYGKGAMLL